MSTASTPLRWSCSSAPSKNSVKIPRLSAKAAGRGIFCGTKPRRFAGALTFPIFRDKISPLTKAAAAAIMEQNIKTHDQGDQTENAPFQRAVGSCKDGRAAAANGPCRAVGKRGAFCIEAPPSICRRLAPLTAVEWAQVFSKESPASIKVVPQNAAFGVHLSLRSPQGQMFFCSCADSERRFLR